MAMGRSGSLALTLAVAASLLQLLLLLPPPVSSLPPRPRPNIPSNAPRTRPLKQFIDLLKRQAPQDKPDSPPSQHKKDDDQLGTGAADTAGLIVYKLSVGTPPAQSFTGIMDITSQFVWAQCRPYCTSTSCLQPSNAVPCSSPASPSSQTCQRVLNQDQPCAADNYCLYEYDYLYGDGAANTSGYLATDTFTFGTTPVTGMVMVFGCSESAGDFYLYGASGVIAFGRGPLSFVSRLQPSRFSYFLAPNDLEAVIQLGSAVPQTLNRSRSIRLLTSSMYPSLYYVKLTGIQVDGEYLNDIPAGTFDLRPDGSGGVFLSTTTPITYLEQAAYYSVRRAFVRRIQSQEVGASAASALGLDLCYWMQSMEKVRVPRLTLVFDGAAAAMELKTANYFFKDSKTGLECLTILPSPDGSYSLLGSLLQTGKNMIYNLDDNMLTFETVGAAAAPPAQVSSLMIIAPCFLVLWVLLC